MNNVYRLLLPLLAMLTLTACNDQYGISGQVLLNDQGLAGVTITVTEDNGTTSVTAQSSFDGSYEVTGLNFGSFTVTPTLADYTFTPASKQVEILDATKNTAAGDEPLLIMTNIDFTAVPVAGTAGATTSNGSASISASSNSTIINNDIVVEPVFSTFLLSYDDNGTLVTVGTDSGQDGVINAVDYYLYDANGTLTSIERDSDNDRQADIKFIYSYDDNSSKLNKIDQDNNLADTVLSNITYTYDYDPVSGLLAKLSLDDNNDGVIDSVTLYSYNNAGKLSQVEFNNDNDAIPDGVIDYFYDDNATLIKVAKDDNYDLISEFIYNFTYNDNSDLATVERDDGDDGVINAVNTYRYDNSNNLTEIIQEPGYDGVLSSSIGVRDIEIF